MISIPSFRSGKTIHSGLQTTIYRAFRETDNLPVIIKILNKEHPTPDESSRFRREYEITQKLNGDGVIRVYDLLKYKNSLAIVEEDFGGESLATLTQTARPDILQIMTIAIRIAECLGQIHRQRIIHKDINPSNILWNPQSGQVKIIDFGISTELGREITSILNPGALEGTLAYISPEQTGRMNRALDYRTDMYSLGATLYEMFTGETPFPTRDPLELVHCHIAVTPAPPHELNPEMPSFLSGVIRKLMAKMAEDRYQSAYGLKADLQRCLECVKAGSAADVSDIGQEDFSEVFQIPQKLYGRDKETAALLGVFEETSSGRSQIVLVTGYAGIGKTAVVHEIKRAIAEKQGYFIEGKFDQLSRNIPYAPLINAFRDLIHQILSEGDASLAQWREKILLALGPNGKVVTEVIPEMELIIGVQADIPAVSPVEAQNRFYFVFQNLIRVFAVPSHPLVIFLDNLQWADQSSLQLIEFIIKDPTTGSLLLIGACRENDMEEGHPFPMAVERMQNNGVQVNRILLSALTLDCVSQLITESLHCSTNYAAELSALCYRKTIGNPFFLGQFLQTLYQEGLIEFDAKYRRWHWEIEKIRGREITENVVEFTVSKIRKLPLETQQILEYASCIGNQFDLRTLSIVCGEGYSETASKLWPALKEELIVPVDESYKFVTNGEYAEGNSDVNMTAPVYRFIHDRVLQASYSLIDESLKPALHLKTGRSMQACTTPETIGDQVFEIVHHFNLSREIIQDVKERRQLAEMNLLAGRKTKASAAYKPAYRYLSMGISYLEKDCWETSYPLALSLYSEAAEAAYLSTDFAQMESLAEIMLAHTRTVLDKSSIYESRIRAYMAQHQPLKAVQTGLAFLEQLGVKLPNHPGKLHIILELLRTKIVLAGKTTEGLILLPEITDQKELTVSKILSIMRASAYWAMPTLYPLLILKGVQQSVRHGNNFLASSNYAGYGVILCGVLDDLENGYRFGLLGQRLVESMNTRESKTRVNMIFNTFIRHWKEHLGTTLTPLMNAYQTGLETGDLEFAGFSAMAYCYQSFFTGAPLIKVEAEMAKFAEAIDRLQQSSPLSVIRIYRQTVLNIMNERENPAKLEGDCYNEDKMLSLNIQANDRTSIFNVYLCKTMLGFLFGEYAEAAANARKAREYLDAVRSTYGNPIFFFYESLIILAIFPALSVIEKKRSLRQVAKNQQKMKKWAHHAPQNNRHKWLLVEAQLAQLEGRDLDAMRFFKEAIRLASENEFLNEEALANELFAQFWLKRGDEEIAGLYIGEAHYCYSNWGAKAKASHLERTYPQLREEAAKGPSSENKDKRTGSVTSSAWGGDALDLASIIKTSQTISSEVDLDALLKKVMLILIENAGAQQGCLMLKKDNELLVRAHIAAGMESATLHDALPIGNCDFLSPAIVHYVARTKQPVVLSDAAVDGLFTRDPYITEKKPLSILCMPVMQQGELFGVLYMENNQIKNAFTSERMEALKILSLQATISIQNALMVNDLKNSRDNLIKSESKYRDLTGMLPDIIYETDLNLNVTYLNKAGQKLTGYYAEDIKRGLNVKDLVTERDYEQIKQMISMDQEQKIMSKHKIIRKDGTFFVGEDNAAMIMENGVSAGLRGSIRDVTEKLQMEEQLLQSQKMEIIGTLAGGLAHDFNNVLSGITGTLSIMQFEITKNQQISMERLRKHIEMMERSGQRAVDMVQQLLTLSRKQETMFAPVDLGGAVKNVVKICKNTFDKAIDIKVDIQADRSMVSADPTQLEQILLNLCVNAGHAMTIMRPEGQNPGGKLEISCDKLRADEHFCMTHPEARQIDYWRLSVRDTGIGMDGKTIAKIFVPFFTTKEKGRGTGLGLSMVYNLVRQHSGFIDVYSEPGLGTTFNVFLPVLYRKGVDVAQERAVEIARGEGLILVVDDEEVLRHVARSILETCGYQVITAENGEEAVAVFRERHAEIRAVLLDMVMPKKSGDQAYLEMKKIDPNIKAILSSGFKQDERVNAILNSGIQSFIQKPYTMEKLSQTIANLLKDDG